MRGSFAPQEKFENSRTGGKHYEGAYDRYQGWQLYGEGMSAQCAVILECVDCRWQVLVEVALCILSNYAVIWG